jgi:hypothetical protein
LKKHQLEKSVEKIEQQLEIKPKMVFVLSDMMEASFTVQMPSGNVRFQDKQQLDKFLAENHLDPVTIKGWGLGSIKSDWYSHELKI